MASRARLIALLALALLLRLAAVLFVGHAELLHGDLDLKNDESTYHQPAVALVTEGCYCGKPGGRPTANRPPGIILPLSFLCRIIGPHPAVALGYVLFCSMAVVVVVRSLAASTVNDPRIAEVATLLAAVLPTFLWASSGIWSDLPALLFTLLTLLALLRVRDGWKKWVTVGACAALAYLNRPSAGLLFPILVAAALMTETRYRVRHAAVLCLTLALPIGAWGLRNWWTMGSFFTGATVAGHTLWESNNPLTAGVSPPAIQSANGVDLRAEAAQGKYLGSWVPATYIPGSEAVDEKTLSEMQAYEGYVDLTVNFLRQHPSAIGRLVVFKLVRLLSAEGVAASITGDTGAVVWLKRSATVAERWFIFAFGALGMWSLYRVRAASRHFYVLFAAAGLGSVLIAYVDARLLLPFTGVVLVPAALGVVRFADLFAFGKLRASSSECDRCAFSPHGQDHSSPKWPAT
jgi:hypothetical protein